MTAIYTLAGGGFVATTGPAGLSIQGDPGPPGGRGEPGPIGPDGRQGPPGAGVVQGRTASVTIPPWCAVVPDGPSGCRPADTGNPAHRGLVLGIAVAGGLAGTSIAITTVGDVSGSAGAWSVLDPLYPGPGGALTPTPPASGWRQIVATAVAANRVVVVLGAARRIIQPGEPIDPGSGGPLGIEAWLAARPTSPPAGPGVWWINNGRLERTQA